MDWAEFIDACIPEPRTIVVEAYQGAGGYGDLFAAAVQVSQCVVEDTNRKVTVQTGDAEGDERLSSTTVYAPPTAVVPAGSRVTLPTGRTALVLAVSYLDAHGQPLPEHWELSLE
ncbi:hypothetical protein [Actinoplanes sp. NPDC049599]|uniref:hypothetical protein n=1 Tax=Actinoplanes sp. NPDC049599 TaxID=3363903 RepID=UPI00379956AA